MENIILLLFIGCCFMFTLVVFDIICWFFLWVVYRLQGGNGGLIPFLKYHL